MLVIAHYLEQETVITVPPSDEPTTIVLRIIDVRGNKVRCGWTAPVNVKVNRREIQDLIDSDKEVFARHAREAEASRAD